MVALRFWVIARLNHLALVRFEYKALFLKIVDVAFVGTFAIDKTELHKDERSQSQHHNGGNPTDYFTFVVIVIQIKIATKILLFSRTCKYRAIICV